MDDGGYERDTIAVLRSDRDALADALQAFVAWWDSLPIRDYQPRNHKVCFDALKQARAALARVGR